MFSELSHWFECATQAAKPTVEAIDLNYFVDLEFDRAGWYSLGHHDHDDFSAIVKAHDPDSLFSQQPVQLAWASISGQYVQLSHFPCSGFEPITYVEGLD